MNSPDYSIDKKSNLVREKVPVVTVTLDGSDEENDVKVNDRGTETGNCCRLEFVKSSGLGPQVQDHLQSSSSNSNKTRKTIVTIDLTDDDEEIIREENCSCSSCSDLHGIMHLPTTAVSPASELELSDENLAKSSQINAFILPPPPSFADNSAADINESEISNCADKDVKDQQENQVFHASGDREQWVEHTEYSPSSPAHDPSADTQDSSLSSPESVNFRAAENTSVEPEGQINHTNEISNEFHDNITGGDQIPEAAQTAIAGTSQNSSFSSLFTATQKLTTKRTGTKTQEQLGLQRHSMALRKTRQPSKRLQEHQQQLQPSNDETGQVNILSKNSTHRKNQIRGKPTFCLSESPLDDNITRVPAGDRAYYRCNFCEKEFNLVTLAKYHVRVHTHSNKFRCSQCHKEFAHKKSLKEHENTHSGIKAFQCQFCQNKYYHSSSKFNHQKICRMKAN